METRDIQVSRQRESLIRCSQDINNLIQVASQGGKLLSPRQPLTLEKVLGNDSMTVGFMRKQSDDHEKQIVSLYILALGEASRLFPNSFDSASITDTAFMVLNEYPEFKPEEIVLILKNGIAGKYGKMYHAISCAAVMEWCLNYQSERQNYFQHKVHNSTFEGDRYNAAPLPADPRIKKEFEKVMENFTKQKPKLVYSTDKPETQAQLWMRDFDKLSREQRQPGKIITFVEYKGKMHDIDSYLIERMEETHPGYKERKAAAKPKPNK